MFLSASRSWNVDEDLEGQTAEEGGGDVAQDLFEWTLYSWLLYDIPNFPNTVHVQAAVAVLLTVLLSSDRLGFT